MAAYLWIAVGSALGGVARFWCSGVAARLMGETFPWGTIIVNVIGSFIIGFFATFTGPDGRVFADTLTRQFVMIGILGGYTTFSSFSLQTLTLSRTANGGWPAPTSPSPLSPVLSQCGPALCSQLRSTP